MRDLNEMISDLNNRIDKLTKEKHKLMNLKDTIDRELDSVNKTMHNYATARNGLTAIVESESSTVGRRAFEIPLDSPHNPPVD